MGDLTLGQLWAVIVGVLSGIILITNAAHAIVKTWKAAKAPEDQQNERIKVCEDRLSVLETSVRAGWKIIDAQKDSSRLSQEALLALLDHGINGNNIEQMKVAKEKLRQHLLNH